MINSDEDLEILTVQAKVGNFTCRFINAYGPSEGCSRDEKTIAFYAKLDQEIKNSKMFGHMTCLQLDANAKLGYDVIKGDPHCMSSNGELLYDVINRNNMIVCNALENCNGSITRQRSTAKGTEASIIDYFIICQDMYTYFQSMKIDDVNVLTRYFKKKDKIYVTKSDHNVLICQFSQKWNSDMKTRKDRYEVFNFKNKEGLKKYQMLTSSTELQDCFQGASLVDATNIWFRKFKNILYRSFPIIRIKERVHGSKDSEIEKMIRLRSIFLEIIVSLKKVNCQKIK